MKVKEKEFKPPFTVTIIDLMDAYHYADFFDDYRYKVLASDFGNLEDCISLADRLFWALNPYDNTQEEWYEMDKGWDVRVYDKEASCVYKAHEILPTKKDLESIEKSFNNTKQTIQVEDLSEERNGQVFQMGGQLGRQEKSKN